jgi:hypothetical protein
LSITGNNVKSLDASLREKAKRAASKYQEELQSIPSPHFSATSPLQQQQQTTRDPFRLSPQATPSPNRQSDYFLGRNSPISMQIWSSPQQNVEDGEYQQASSGFTYLDNVRLEEEFPTALDKEDEFRATVDDYEDDVIGEGEDMYSRVLDSPFVVQQHSSSFLPNGKLMTVLSFVTFQ